MKKKSDFDFSFLRELRSQKEITLEGLAEAAGVSFSTLTRIESNQNQPNLATIKQLSDYFGMTPSHFLELATASIVQKVKERPGVLGGIKRRMLDFPDIQLRVVDAEAGQKADEAHRHENDYQLNWVLDGRMIVNIHDREYRLEAGEAVKFDAGYDHSVRVLENATYLIAVISKRLK